MSRFLQIKLIYIIVIFLMPGMLLAKTSLYKYALSLESTPKKFQHSLSLKKYKLQRYIVYQQEVNLGRGRIFHRLRIGFFKSKKEASRAAKKLISKYPKLWIDVLNKSDRGTLKKWLKKNKKGRKKLPNKKISGNKEKKARKLMLRANKAMKNKKYRAAAGLYTRIISFKNTHQHQQAMEFLGLAREKNGQLIHARAEYRLYLKKYKKGEDSLRVRQRLLSLKTLLLKPRKRLRKGKLNKSDWQFFGSLMQFYRLDAFDSGSSNTKNETFSTNVNFLLRKRTKSFNIKSQFNANHLEYINNPLREGKAAINLAFVDIADINNNKSIRVGRQSQSKGGVLGKMDGVWLGYRISPRWKLNMVSGFPVQTSTSNLAQSNRPFIGVSADIGTIKKHWFFNVYTINQKIDSLVDRNAIGGEVRYRKDRQNHFALIDYDTFFDDLNTFFYVGNWKLKNKAAIILTVNHRNSPILTMLNSTIGQTTSSVEDLLLEYTESELKQIAKDRTAKYNSASISTTIPISKKWSFNADGTVSNLSATPASPNVTAIDGTGNEFFYSAQFIANDVFHSSATTRYQVRYDDTKTFNRMRFTASSRFRLKNKKWRIRPQITFEKRNGANGSVTNKVKTGIKLDYKIKRKLKLELDVSYETGKTTFPVIINENNYHVSAGFIWDF